MPKTTFERDKLGRVTKKVTLAGAIYYQYDASGKRTSLKDPDLSESVYTYDSAGRLTELTLDGSRKTYFFYDDSGLVTKKLLHDHRVMSYYMYDNATRLTTLRNLDNSANEITYFHYTRNDNGAITRIDRKSNGGEYHVFAYDELERLTTEEHLKPNTPKPDILFHLDYDYDAASNRTRKGDFLASEDTYYEYDSRNLVETEWTRATPSATYFDHDDVQRMTALRSASAQSSYFTFDQRDQVTQIDFELNGGGADSTREFVHNGLGERVFVKDGAGAFNQTYWAYDGQKLIREGKTDGAAARKYRHNQSCHDMRGSLVEIYDGVLLDELYPAMDQRGSVLALEDSGGSAAGEFAFDAFLDRLTDTVESHERAQAMSRHLSALNTTNVQISAPVGAGLYLPEHGISTIGSTAAAGWLAFGPAVLAMSAWDAIGRAGALAAAGAAAGKTDPFRGIRPGGFGVWLDGGFYAPGADGRLGPVANGDGGSGGTRERRPLEYYDPTNTGIFMVAGGICDGPMGGVFWLPPPRTCCCCAESVVLDFEMVKVKGELIPKLFKFKPDKQPAHATAQNQVELYGHKVTAKIDLKLKPGPAGRCKLKWLEYTNRVPAKAIDKGMDIRPNQWFDYFADPEGKKGPVFGKWRTHLGQPLKCPRKKHLELVDEPKAALRARGRSLTIEVVVESSPGCQCAKDRGVDRVQQYISNSTQFIGNLPEID